MVKYLHISSFIRKLFHINDIAPDPIDNARHMDNLYRWGAAVCELWAGGEHPQRHHTHTTRDYQEYHLRKYIYTMHSLDYLLYGSYRRTDKT